MIKRHLILVSVFAIVLILIVLILLMSGPRMRYQPSVKSYEMEMALPPEDIVPFDHRKYDPAVTLPVANSKNISRGIIYYSYYCVFCHGDDGKGNGEVGKSYLPKPADLTRDSIRRYNIEKLYYASFTGTGHSPVLERVVPYEHRPYILAYIRHGFR